MTTDTPESFTSATDTYHVIRRFAQGGMGTTYLVRSEKSEQVCLLKRLRLDKAARWKNVERFEREARVLEALDHPSIPRYVDFIELSESGELAIVQAFVEGRTMQAHIDDDIPVSVARFESYLRQCLEVVAYLHRLVPPVIHRDVSPKNVILGEGRAYLVDFGAVRLAAATPTDTVTAIGTFGYMSPEQIMGQAVEASDLFSLGMTFVALAGHADPSQLPLDAVSGRVGSRIAMKTWDGFKVFDAGNGELIVEIETGASIHELALSPDGTLVASGGWDEVVRVWDVNGGR